MNLSLSLSLGYIHILNVFLFEEFFDRIFEIEIVVVVVAPNSSRKRFFCLYFVFFCYVSALYIYNI